jgi:tetratricopeptide (TPR) repeat protein
MDLLDFEARELYFDTVDEPGVATLIRDAAANYGEAEAPLLQAYALAPRSLNVLVALYRFYYYRHRLTDALKIAAEALEVLRIHLDFPPDWRDLTTARLAAVTTDAKVQLRFYLFTLKAEGFLHMRLHNLDLSREIFEKLVELDAQDRIGAAGLLHLVMERLTQYTHT